MVVRLQRRLSGAGSATEKGAAAKAHSTVMAACVLDCPPAYLPESRGGLRRAASHPPARCAQQAERVGAARLVIVAPDEWARGQVRVKDLATGEQRDVPLEEL